MSGARSMRPRPTADRSQVQFRYDYSGGWKRSGRQTWSSFEDRCRPYDGPRLVWLVAACKAPDGSYWALQRWQRLLPMRGIAPFRSGQAAFELHISHWRGPLPVLEMSPNWTYGGSWQGLFGRLTYRGLPVHGFRTPSPTRRDPNARFFYVDTFNSVFGAGWRHDAGKVAHNPNGAFCYSFVPQPTPPGYPTREIRPPGNGERHRVTVMGPGVTPVIQWVGKGLGRYDPQRDAQFNTPVRSDRRPGRQGVRSREIAVATTRFTVSRGRALSAVAPISTWCGPRFDLCSLCAPSRSPPARSRPRLLRASRCPTSTRTCSRLR